MGIVRGSARLLLDEAHRRPFTGTVLQLARTSIFFTEAELRRWARKHGVALAADAATSLSHDPRLAMQGCLSDRSFFHLLGFDQVVSADISDYEGADILWDLNQPAPETLYERFDLVFEGGTIQHIFDLRQVFANIHSTLKTGGRVIHAMSPSNNHVDHGFYMFSPTLFADTYSTFGYRIETIYLCDFLPFWFHGRLFSRPFRIYRYLPGSLDHLSYGRWGNRQTNIFVVATKLPGASSEAVPQQGQYRRLWAKAQAGHTSGAPAPSIQASNPRHASRLMLAWKLVRELSRRFGPKKRPPTIARY